MSRLAIACVLALAATAAHAQDAKSGQSQAPVSVSGNELRPFQYDARKPGDGRRQNAPAGHKHPNSGAIVQSDKKSN